MEDKRFTDDAMQQARYSDVYGKRMSTVNAASRKRKPVAMDVDDSPVVQAPLSDTSNRKLVRLRLE